MSFGNVGASAAQPVMQPAMGWLTPIERDEDGYVRGLPILPTDPPADTEVPNDGAPDPTAPRPAPAPAPTPEPEPVPAPSTPGDDTAQPTVERNTALATLRSMRQSSGAAFADSAYFSGLFTRDDDATQRSGVKPDWQTIGMAGGTVVGLGGLYRIGTNINEIKGAKQVGTLALEGAARAVVGLGKLAIFATPVIAAGVAAPALADLASLAAPSVFKRHQEIPADATQSERNAINNNNDSAWLGRIAAGSVLVGGLAFGALALHQKPLPGLLGQVLGQGMPAAFKGAAALGLVGGVSAGAFYNIFDKNGDISRTHSPLRSY